MNSKELLNKGLKFLKANGIQSPALDSEIIAADLLNISREPFAPKILSLNLVPFDLLESHKIVLFAFIAQLLILLIFAQSPKEFKAIIAEKSSLLKSDKRHSSICKVL